MQWVDAAPHKQAFVAANPYTNYVEVENYYTKALIGWGGDAKGGKRTSLPAIGRQELEEAKRVLRSFDMVLITEWTRNVSQQAAFDKIFPGSRHDMAQQLVQGSSSLRQSYAPKLLPQGQAMESLLHRLRLLNVLDMELYRYALELTARRHTLIVNSAGSSTGAESGSTACSTGRSKQAVLKSTPGLMKKMGIFRPPGHKT